MDLAVDSLAWAAGVFEGEGCIGVRKHAQYKDSVYSRMTISMTDADVIQRFRDAVGVGTVQGPHNYGNKPVYRWYVGTVKEVEALILRLAPWLSSRRLVQAVNALAADSRRR